MIKQISKNEIKDFCYLINKVISNTSYYKGQGVIEELKEYNPKQIKNRIKENTDVYLGYFENKNIIGFLHGYFDMGTFWLNWVGVDVIHRKKGIAIKLMQHLESFLKNKNIHKIWLDVKQNNIESLSLFLKLNYKICAKIDNHWYNSDFYFCEKILQ